MPRHPNSTSFQPGQSGNPRGRRPGTQNLKTVAAREVAARLVDDPEYREALRQRMITGTAGAMEVLLWYYAKGKPVDRVETGAPGAFTELTNAELKARLAAAVAAI